MFLLSFARLSCSDCVQTVIFLHFGTFDFMNRLKPWASKNKNEVHRPNCGHKHKAVKKLVDQWQPSDLVESHTHTHTHSPVSWLFSNQR